MITNYFNISAINRCTTSEGPYKRMAIWFQGCTFSCKDCCNPKLQKLEPANLLTLQDLINEVKEAKRLFNIEGVTLTGGEPTLQNNLPLLCKELKNLGLGIILFTGNNYDNLDSKLLSNIDTVIDGLFLKTQIDLNRKFIGSKNQKVYHISNRYNDELFNNEIYKQINITANNNSNLIVINGDVSFIKIEES